MIFKFSLFGGKYFYHQSTFLIQSYLNFSLLAEERIAGDVPLHTYLS